MKQLIVSIICCLLAPIGIMAADNPFVDLNGFEGKVTGIEENGSLYIQANGLIEEVVLIGMKLPKDSIGSEELFRKKTIDFLKKYSLNKKVRIKLPAMSRDKERRLLGYVWREQDNTLINFAVIRMGFGHAQVEGEYLLKRELNYAEKQAREEGLGLWGRSLKEIVKTGKKIKESEKIINPDLIIYVSSSDKKYHRDYCRQLQKDRYPVKLKDVIKAGYTPCLICHPPE